MTSGRADHTELVEVSREVAKLLDRIAQVTHGSEAELDLYMQGSWSRMQDVPFDHSQPESWKTGWQDSDAEFAGNDAFSAGRPLDSSKPQAWIVGYLALERKSRAN